MSATSLAVALGRVPWEPALVAGLGHPSSRVRVVRRCVDRAELLTAAASGHVTAVAVSEDLRLDRDAVARLTAYGVVVVGLAADEDGERALRRSGIERLVPVDPADLGRVPGLLLAAIREAVVMPAPSGYVGHDSPDVLSVGDQIDGVAADVDLRLPGVLVAVWGPPGSPGRTSVAVAIADEAAASGVPTLLVDGHARAAGVAAALGITDDTGGLAAAARRADSGRLDTVTLAGLCREVAPRLRVLTGLPRPDRWHELRPAALTALWDVARRLDPFVVVDIGSDLDADDEALHDTLAARRHAAAVTALDAADLVVAVTAAEPVSLARFIGEVEVLRELWPQVPVEVAVTRVRSRVVGRDPGAQVSEAITRHTGLTVALSVPYDRLAYDDAAREGRTLRECAPRSSARAAVAGYVDGLLRRRSLIDARRAG